MEDAERRYYGKFKGFIRDNDDPENRGRVRVYCPQVMGTDDNENAWLDWAEPCFPWLGGMNTGDFGPPLTRDEQIADIGSEWYGVWIEFQDGRVDFPIWVGTFTVAATPTASTAHQLGTTGGGGLPGGGIIGSGLLPGDSDDSDLNPPAAKATREVRLRAQKGIDIVIGVENGGYIIVGPSGVHLTGVQLTLNGQPFFASATKISG